MLANLVKKNMLVATGYGRGMKYSVNRNFMETMSETKVSVSEYEKTMSEVRGSVSEAMSEYGKAMSKVEAQVSENMSELERTRMEIIYEYMSEYEAVTSAKVAEILKVGTKTASRLLNKAEKYKLLRSEGKTSNKRYFMV